MFQIEYHKETQIVSLTGKLDSSKTSEANEVFDKIEDSFTIDMSNLDFICSVGMGSLVKTYTRLKEKGENVYLTNLNSKIKKILKVSLLDRVFEIK